MTAYYNENDPFAANWLRNLIKAGLVADGDVDDRSIEDVTKKDLKGYTQTHFFAGIGGWSYALRLAGWPDDRPIWTGSCPCQPFSVSGVRKGVEDPRHLWPAFESLISQCRPAVVFGEQVASKDGRSWLSDVRTDLEALGYAVGAADLCAAGVGAPHIRQRLWWVADAHRTIKHKRPPSGKQSVHNKHDAASRRANTKRDASQPGRATVQPGEGTGEEAAGAPAKSGRRGVSGGVGNTNRQGSQGRIVKRNSADQSGPWASGVALYCTDGKTRLVEAGTFPLAHGVPARMGKLRGYGNAIVPQVAAEFIGAYMDAASVS